MDEQDQITGIREDQLVGPHEIINLMGISRQYFWLLTGREDWPERVAQLAATGVWLKSEIVHWIETHPTIAQPRKYQNLDLIPGLQQRMVDAYEAGQSIRKIADTEGISYGACQKALYRFGVEIRPGGRHLRTPPEVEMRVAQAYRNGEAIPVIISRENLTAPCVYRILQRLQVPMRKSGPPRKVSEDTENDIVKLYASGRTIREIMAEMHIPQGTVYNVLKRRNVEFRNRVGRNQTIMDEETEKRIVESYQAGDSINKVALREGWSNSVVLNVLRRAGVPRRPPNKKKR